jgi:hypothetical protein
MPVGCVIAKRRRLLDEEIVVARRASVLVIPNCQVYGCDFRLLRSPSGALIPVLVPANEAVRERIRPLLRDAFRWSDAANGYVATRAMRYGEMKGLLPKMTLGEVPPGASVMIPTAPQGKALAVPMASRAPSERAELIRRALVQRGETAPRAAAIAIHKVAGRKDEPVTVFWSRWVRLPGAREALKSGNVPVIVDWMSRCLLERPYAPASLPGHWMDSAMSAKILAAFEAEVRRFEADVADERRRCMDVAMLGGDRARIDRAMMALEVSEKVVMLRRAKVLRALEVVRLISRTTMSAKQEMDDVEARLWRPAEAHHLGRRPAPNSIVGWQVVSCAHGTVWATSDVIDLDSEPPMPGWRLRSGTRAITAAMIEEVLDRVGRDQRIVGDAIGVRASEQGATDGDVYFAFGEETLIAPLRMVRYFRAKFGEVVMRAAAAWGCPVSVWVGEPGQDRLVGLFMPVAPAMGKAARAEVVRSIVRRACEIAAARERAEFGVQALAATDKHIANYAAMVSR